MRPWSSHWRLQDLIAIYADEALVITLPAREPPVTLAYDVAELTEVRDFPALTRRTTRGLAGNYWYRRRPLVIWDDDDNDLQHYGDLYNDDLLDDHHTRPQPRMTGEQLIDKLMEATPQGNWDEERYSMTYADGVLIVTQRPGIQAQIANILVMLKLRR